MQGFHIFACAHRDQSALPSTWTAHHGDVYVSNLRLSFGGIGLSLRRNNRLFVLVAPSGGMKFSINSGGRVSIYARQYILCRLLCQVKLLVLNRVQFNIIHRQHCEKCFPICCCRTCSILLPSLSFMRVCIIANASDNDTRKVVR